MHVFNTAGTAPATASWHVGAALSPAQDRRAPQPNNANFNMNKGKHPHTRNTKWING